MACMVSVDTYKSMTIIEDLSKEVQNNIFTRLHYMMQECFDGLKGELWNQNGDGSVFIFETSMDAVDACIRFSDQLTSLNEEFQKDLKCPLFVRIGIHETRDSSLKGVPREERGTHSSMDLSIVCKLQKHCPIGKMLITMQVYNKIGVFQHLFRPATMMIQEVRNCFIIVDRLIMPQERLLIDGLMEKHRKFIPPIPFTAWNKIKLKPEDNKSLADLDTILSDKLMIVLGETISKSEGPICSAATSDAVGIMEVMAALKTNTDVRVGIDRWEDNVDEISDRNIIIIGSGMVNIFAFAINDIIEPVHFVKAHERVHDKIFARSDNERYYFGPHDLGSRDCGLMVISKSPFNNEKYLLWVAGITGMGTQAVARFLWDIIRDSRNIFNRIGLNAPDKMPVACVVCADVGKSGNQWSLSDFRGRWRIYDYKVLWAVNYNGKTLIHPEM